LTKVHRTSFAGRALNRYRSHVFPILNTFACSGDIRDQTRDLRKIGPTFVCFDPKFLYLHYKIHQDTDHVVAPNFGRFLPSQILLGAALRKVAPTSPEMVD